MTSIETGPSWSERLNPRNWTLAWKLVIVGLVPGVARPRPRRAPHRRPGRIAADLGRGTRLLEISTQVSAASDALRQERDQATLFVAGNRQGGSAPMNAISAQTEAADRRRPPSLRGSDDLKGTATTTLLQAQAGLDQLAGLRADVTGDTASSRSATATRRSSATSTCSTAHCCARCSTRRRPASTDALHGDRRRERAARPRAHGARCGHPGAASWSPTTATSSTPPSNAIFAAYARVPGGAHAGAVQPVRRLPRRPTNRPRTQAARSRSPAPRRGGRSR